MENIKAIYQNLTTLPFFKETYRNSNNEFFFRTGAQYKDETDMIFCLTSRNNSITLTDKGRTRAYLDKIYDLEADDVIEIILKIEKYYKLYFDELKINSIGDFTNGFLRMLYGISFMDSIQLFYYK